MYILYLDDAGSPGNRSERHFVLGGFCVAEQQINWFSRKLDDLAAEYYPESPSSVEFHASEIFSGRIPPWDGMSKPERINAIKRVLQTFNAAYRETRLFACVIHKASYDQDPVEIAFENLCNRFDLYLKRVHALTKEKHRGLIILDKSSSETSLQDLANNFRNLGTRWGVMRHVVEAPLFIDSRATRLIQLADHVAYAVFRRYEASDGNYFDPVLHKFDSEEGKIHGLLHLPQNVDGCMCQACLSRNLS